MEGPYHESCFLEPYNMARAKLQFGFYSFWNPFERRGSPEG
jgi:hypothetical protein